MTGLLRNYRSARHFARVMLADNRVPIGPGLLHWHSPKIAESVLWRAGNCQIEMVIALPWAEIPRHRHNRVDSCDVMIAGSSEILIGDRRHHIVAHKLRGQQPRRLDVPVGVWHEGRALEQGAIYLSFQFWLGEPDLIGKDWEQWTA